MQNYEQILSELGIEVPDDKKADLKKKMNENYRTKTDYDGVVAKRDEYKASLEDVQGKLDGFKDVDVADLKGQIATLTTQLADEKAARAQDAQRVETEKNVNAFLSSVGEDGNKKYEFINGITEDFYRGKLLEELSKDSAKGKSIGDIFTVLITGEDGKQKTDIFVDRKQEQLEAGRAKPFTGPIKGAAQPTTAERWKSMSLDERMKLKSSDHAAYERMRKGD